MKKIWKRLSLAVVGMLVLGGVGLLVVADMVGAEIPGAMEKASQAGKALSKNDNNGMGAVADTTVSIGGGLLFGGILSLFSAMVFYAGIVLLLLGLVIYLSIKLLKKKSTPTQQETGTTARYAMPYFSSL